MPAEGEERGLRHQLGAGQMAMVAVGGSIGTGLLLGSAAALEIAGPGVILSFVLAAFIGLTVTLALGELSSVHPAAGSFGVYADLYLNQWAGFIARAGYWAAISISIGAELVASATYLAFWLPSVPALFWVVIFSVLLLLINLRSVGNYARFEYWFAMIKVATIAAFVVLGAGLLLSGRVTPEYTAHGGFFPKGALAPLLAMGFALYTFGGIEFVAITTGESRSPQEIPRAVKLTFAILASVYLGAIVVLVGVMPWNRAGVTESPFVTVFRHAHVPAAPHIMTFVILTAALSGANAALYAASRVLFSLARTGWAPAVLGRLNAFRISEARGAGFVLRDRGRAGAGEVGAEECFRLDSGCRPGRNVAVLAGFTGRPRPVPPEALNRSTRRVAHAVSPRGLGLGAGIRADSCGSPGDWLELSLDTDQRRRVYDRADSRLFPAERSEQRRWSDPPLSTSLRRLCPTPVIWTLVVRTLAKSDLLRAQATTKNQMQQRRTRVSVPHWPTWC